MFLATLRLRWSPSRPIGSDPRTSWMRLSLDLPADTPDWEIARQLKLLGFDMAHARLGTGALITDAGRPHTHATAAEARECSARFAHTVRTRRGATAPSKPAPAQPTLPEPEIRHDDPCVCGVYDRCSAVRAGDARRSGNWRDNFRAYND